MRLASIEIKDFRAFKGVPLKIDLTSKGKNLLVYGENGSGKSSLYFALRDFLEAASKSSDITKPPFRNIFVNTDDGFLKLDFSDAGNDPDAKLYEWSLKQNDTSEQLVLEIDKTKGFIDYKALLRTHLLQNESDSVNIFNLLVTTLLANITNDMTKRTFGEDWRTIQQSIPRRNVPNHVLPLEERLKEFNDGLRVKLADLKDRVKEILTLFGYENIIELEFGFAGVSYNGKSREQEKGFDNCTVGVRVKFYSQELAEHQHVLNEAKLSAIAMAIFFAALTLQPAPPHGLRVLALDDMLIGLDMSHRLPVLEIIEKYFNTYQIFLFTYDRAWYDLVKQSIFARKADSDWKFVEFFAGSTFEHDLPVWGDDKKYMDRAKAYLANNDYKAAVIYLRTEFETILKAFCRRKGLRVRYEPSAKDLKSQDFWNAILAGNDASAPPFIDAALQAEIETYRRVILNPLSHAEIVSIFKKEVEDTIRAVEKLDKTLLSAPKKGGAVIGPAAVPFVAPATPAPASSAAAPTSSTTAPTSTPTP
jgi:energy-coupling factor transporter ATP-binding protein EcfA2